MADDLSVRSPGAGGAGVAAAGQAPAQGEVSRLDQQVAELKGRLKDKLGRTFDDSTLRALVQRRESRASQQAKTEEVRRDFTSGRASESLTNAKSDATTRAQQTLGTQATREADGLPPQQRTAVRGDTRAGATLPPGPPNQLQPQQAASMLGRMMGAIEQNGLPIDPRTYAQTLVPKPPTSSAQGQSAVPARGGTQPPTTQPAGAQAPATPRAGLEGRTTRGTANANTATAPAQTSGPVRLPSAPRPQTALAIGTGGGSGAARPASGEVRNLGGALVSTGGYDGMHFNMDAFFTLFMLRYTQDSADGKRAMRELRDLMGKLAIDTKKFEITLAQYQQSVARRNAAMEVGKQLGKLAEAPMQDQITALMGGDQHTTAALDQQARKELAKMFKDGGEKPAVLARFPRYEKALAGAKGDVSKLTPQERALGIVHLSKEELQQLSDTPQAGQKLSPRAHAQKLVDTRNGSAGLLGQHSTLVTRLRGPGLSEADKRAIQTQLSDVQQQMRAMMQNVGRDPVGAAMINRQLRSLAAGALDKRSSPDDRQVATQSYNALMGALTTAGYRGEGEHAAGAKIAALGADDWKAQFEQLAGADELGFSPAERQFMARQGPQVAGQTHADTARTSGMQAAAPATMTPHPDDAQIPRERQDELQQVAQVVVGKTMLESRREALFDLDLRDKVNWAADAVSGLAGQASAIFGGAAAEHASKLFSQARSDRKSVEAKINGTHRQAQGMLNQLAAVLAAGRAQT